MLASSFLDPVLGIDIHFEMVPTPAPVPLPLPNPFIGLVFDPIGLAAGIALGAVIGAVVGAPFQGPVLYWTAFPATNTGTEAKHVPGHFIIPPGTIWAPFPKTPKPVIRPGETPTPGLPVKPENDAVVVFGSKTVSVMGSNAVRLGDIALSCSEPLRLPSSVVLAIPKGAPILIGGPMSLDIMSAIMASLRTRFVSDSLHALVSRLSPGRFRNFLHRAVCFFTGHPVDVASGKVMTEFVDIELPGPIPLKVERIYSSAFASRPGVLGHGWSLSLDQAVWRERGKVVLLGEDGREIEFDTFDFPKHRIEAGQKVYNPIERLTLHCEKGETWRVVDHEGVVREFAPVPGRDDGRAMIQKIRSRCGYHEIGFHYGVEGGTQGASRGRLEWVRDSGGRFVHLRWDAQGRVTELHLPQPQGEGFYRHRRYEYDESGDLVKVTDSLGHDWKFAYVTHLLTQETDRNGLSFYFQYDGLGEDAWCVRTWGDGGIYDHVLGYDKSKKITYVTNSLGHTTQYHMNVVGQVVKIVDPLGGETKYEYDAVTLQKVAEIDPLGHQTTLRHDARGNATEKHHPDGSSQQLRHDERGLVVEARDAIGGSWRWSYDHHGQLVSHTDPCGTSHRFEYRDGLLARAIRPGGGVTQLAHDQHKNLARVRTSTGGDYWLTHDRQGRIIGVRDPRNTTEQRRFDSEGRLVEVVKTTGRIRQSHYDPEGNLLRATDGSREITMIHGNGNKLLRRTEADASVAFHYDTEGRLVAVVNELGERHEIAYDPVGRPSRITEFDGRIIELVRDAAGRVIETRGPGPKAHSRITYDAMGRITKVVREDGSSDDYAYRPDGALQLARNEDAEVRFERDPLGRVVLEQTNDDWIQSTYAPDGTRTRVKSSRGLTQAIERLPLGPATAIHSSLADIDSSSASPWTIRFLRDVEGTKLGMELLAMRESWSHDEAGRPLRRELWSPRGLVSMRDYRWRGNSQLESITDHTSGATRFHHDVRGRLIGVTDPDGHTTLRTLDAAGNAYSGAMRQYARGGRLLQDGEIQYAYDDHGRRTTKLEGERHTQYRWSAAGQLREVELPDGRTVSFRYDALGRRLQKEVHDPRATSGSVRTTRWIWDGNVPVHEQTDGAPEITWIFEPESFIPLGRMQDHRLHGLLTDHIGTPTEAFDEHGAVVWRSHTNTLETGSSSDEELCPFRFPGQYADAETDLCYNRWRYYDPRSHGYIQPDPLGILGGLSLYAYQADPSTNADPLGLSGEGCGLNKGDPLPDDAIIHRIGGGDVSNLVPKPPELKLNPPGISSIRAASPEAAAAMARDVAASKGWTGLGSAASTMGSASAADIRKAGFDVIHDPTKVWGDAHARIIHPDGAAGWTPENIAKLSQVLNNSTGL